MDISVMIVGLGLCGVQFTFNNKKHLVAMETIEEFLKENAELIVKKDIARRISELNNKLDVLENE